MSKNICNICAEQYNKTKRFPVKCNCEFECCRTCIKTYILDKNEEPSCMSCNEVWDRKFMSDNFERTFMNKTFKIHRENILIEREISMLQATQPYVEREINIEKIKKEIYNIKIEHENKMKDLYDTLYYYQDNVNSIERKKFIRKCPNNVCKGFLSSALKCELCNCWACSECREIKGYTTEEKDKHECNKEILESIKFMEKDTKECPGCSALIFKIMGCSYMWCTECHTSFNWRTLRIESGINHNPEYYEYLRRTTGSVERNPNDIQCGREIDIHFIHFIMNTFEKDIKLPEGWTKHIDRYNRIYYKYKGKVLYNQKRPEIFLMSELCRNIIHINHVEKEKFRVLDNLNKNLQLRIDYMRNKINKEEFKVIIQKKDKDYDKKKDIINILNMYTTCATDILYRLNDNPLFIEEVTNELYELKNYTNECLERVSKVYNCKQYELNELFVFV